MPTKFIIFDSDALKNIHKRVFFSITLFAIVFSIIFFRIYEVMISSKSLQIMTENKQIQERGKIFDRNGVLLASTIKKYSLYVHPKKLKNINNLSFKLSEILSIPESEINSKLLKNTKFEYIKRNISPTEHQKIMNLGIIELQTEIENARIYPLRETTSHVVGFTNIDEIGLSGIEKGLEKKLSSGENIHLSIDARLQASVRNELIETIQKFSAESGLSIVLEINSGQILSIVNYPDFDPNFVDKILPNYQFNSATQGVYEMGSTFKPITVAIGYDRNIINSGMFFDVSKPIRYGKYTINDFHPVKDKLNIKDILVKSSNIGAAKIATKIGKKNQIEYFKKFGFYEKINLEIDETALPLAPKHWKKLETMTIGYGHGFSITPLHLCQTYASIVNGGFQVKPTLLKNKKFTNLKRLVKLSTSAEVNKLLRSVILETKYTGPLTRIEGYDIGGKTGTSELITNGNYSSTSNLAIFIGVFPISNPQYVVLAMVKDPKKIQETNFNNTGGWVAAPLVKRIILNIIKIFSIPAITEKTLLKASNDKYNIIKKNVTF